MVGADEREREMIQHASLMDVFNAAGQAASPFLGKYTEKYKKRNDLQIELNIEDYKNERANWLRDNPYDGNVESPEAYRDRLNNFTNKLFLEGNGKKGEEGKKGYLYKGLIAGNSSAYYQEQMRQVQDKALKLNEGTALEAHDEWRMSDERRQCVENVQAGMEYDDAQEGWRYIERSVELLCTQQYVSPEQKAKMLQDFGTSLYQRHYARVVDAAGSLEDLQKAVAELKYGKPVLDKDGKPVLGEDGKPKLEGGFAQFMPRTQVTKFYEEEEAAAPGDPDEAPYVTEGDDLPYLDEETGEPARRIGGPEAGEAGGKREGEGRKGRPVLDENGRPVTEERAWSFPEEWETKVLQERAGAIIQGEEGFFRRLVVSGEFDKAIAYAQDKGSRLNRCYNKDDPGGFYGLINDGQRKQFDGFFDYKTLKGFIYGGGAGGSGRGKWQALEYYDADTFNSAMVYNNGHVALVNPKTGDKVYETDLETFRQAREEFLRMNVKIFWDNHNNEYTEANVQKLEKLHQAWWNEWHASLWKKIQENPEKAELKTVYDKFKSLDTYRKGGAYYNSNIKDEDRYAWEQGCLSYFSDFFMGCPHPDAQQIEDAMKAFIAKDVGEIMKWGRTPDEQGEAWKKQAEIDRQARSSAAEKLIWTDSQGNVRFRTTIESHGEKSDEYNIMAQMERERESLGYGLGKGVPLDLRNVKWGWTRSKTQQDDITPKAYFIVEHGKGVTNPGIYRVDYDKYGNQIIMRYTGPKKEDGAGKPIVTDDEKQWEEFDRRQRPDTKAETYDKRMYELEPIIKSIEKGFEPGTGKPFRYQDRAPDTLNPNDPREKYILDHWRSLPPDTQIKEWARHYHQQGAGRK
jgi:hypothetical protein